jgi:hypothetical protein
VQSNSQGAEYASIRRPAGTRRSNMRKRFMGKSTVCIGRSLLAIGVPVTTIGLGGCSTAPKHQGKE